jgi:putative phosphoribosyl transferase
MAIVDHERIFANRSEAGIELAKILERKYRDQNVLVLGIPRGGIVIAYEIAMRLHGDLSVVITKKLPHPLHEELAIGAAAEDKSYYLTTLSRNISKATIKNILKDQEKEIESRVKRFRKGQPLPDMKNRIVIIADDGIATGSTLVPAIKLCRNKEAAKVIVAAPVSGRNYVAEIDELADEVIVFEQPELFYAVGQVYEDFQALSDEEVIQLMQKFDRSNENRLQ